VLHREADCAGEGLALRGPVDREDPARLGVVGEELVVEAVREAVELGGHRGKRALDRLDSSEFRGGGACGFHRSPLSDNFRRGEP